MARSGLNTKHLIKIVLLHGKKSAESIELMLSSLMGHSAKRCLETPPQSRELRQGGPSPALLQSGISLAESRHGRKKPCDIGGGH